MGFLGTNRKRHACSMWSESLSERLGLVGEDSVCFEESAANSAYKFEVAYLFLLLMSAGIYAYFGLGFSKGLPLIPRVKAAIFLPALAGFTFRCFMLSVRGRLSGWRMSPHRLGALCFFFDVLMLTWFEPSDVATFWRNYEESPEDIVPRSIIFNTSAVDLNEVGVSDLARSFEELCSAQIRTHYQYIRLDQLQSRKVRYDESMVIFSVLVLFWYNAGFVLLSRHTLVLLPLSAALFFSGTCGAWRGSHCGSNCVEQHWLEITFCVFSMIVLMSAKVLFESLQRKVFSLLQSKTKDVIHERVLRVQAEFAHEIRLESCAERQHEEDLESGCFVSSSIVEPLKGPRHYAPSHRSAPAVFFSDKLDVCATKKSGECLPRSAVVWVDGKSLPEAVGNIAVGQRVLCYDHIARVPKYVEVVEAENLQGHTPWVDIHLEDGSVLTVTAEHPLLPVEHHSPVPEAKLGCSIAAAHLKPGQQLMTFKTVPVAISKVCPLDMSSGPLHVMADKRVALSVKQPSRFEIFVRTQTHGGASAVAVGSAVLPTDNVSEASCLLINRTFIDLGSRNQTSRRASSEPCRTRLSDINDELQNKPSRCRIVRQKTRAWSDSEVTESSGSVGDSTLSNEECKVLVATFARNNIASLSRFMQVRMSDVPSLGSVGHAAGECHACRFVNKECYKGKFCDHCHEQHPKKGRTPGNVRRAIKQQKRNAASQSGVIPI